MSKLCQRQVDNKSKRKLRNDREAYETQEQTTFPVMPLGTTLSTTAPAFGSSPLFSLAKPFTRRTLKIIRDCLSQHKTTYKPALGGARQHAAVLIPFCNVGGVPGILLQVRAKAMRSHSGEVR